jgi:alpha-N-arabinofuranosidase
MLRPDLLEAVRGLAPPFIRWPGGSFASTYKWQDGVGPFVSRVHDPNEIWAATPITTASALTSTSS